jgi:ABC-type glycerol-3-phosphate transport system substrate-binding protein
VKPRKWGRSKTEKQSTTRYSLFALLGAFIFSSIGACGLFEPSTAILWTDRPEFAIYAEYFNSSQAQYKVEVRYVEALAQKLTDTKEAPDIVIGSWLKSASTRTLFKPLDHLFKKELLSKNAFYPRLLALGTIEEQQYLLPVAFNIPGLVFTRAKGQLLSNPFTISLEEIKTLGKAHNHEQNGIYSQMGFSPAWDPEFLYIIANLFNTSFREGDPLLWDQTALDKTIEYIRDWIQNAAGAIQAEDDFVFKYFYQSPAVLVLSGRILFIYMNSADFFTLPQERRVNLDFRWIAENDSIPLLEGTVYYGKYKKGKAAKASEAFTQWFFKAETQRLLLENSKRQRLNETLFGISSGFSALRSVTEQIFPQFYPTLLGHMPPVGFLTPPHILPYNWGVLKERVILPYLQDMIRTENPETIRPLERQIADWYKINKEF